MSSETETTEQQPKKRTVRKILGASGYALLLLVLFVLLINAFLCVFKDGYYPTIGGNRLFSVVTDSMEPVIPEGSMIVDKKPTGYGDVKIGSIITFERMSGKSIIVLTHRVESITYGDGGMPYYTTRGDNAVDVDGFKTPYSAVVGVYSGKKCGGLGYLFGFLQSTHGAVTLIILFLVVILVRLILDYINRNEKRRALEGSALKRSAQALSQVNLRYDNIREITAVLDVIGMLTDRPTNGKDRAEIDKRLLNFINAESIELPQTPETARILDSLPAPDTPDTLASALAAGATLRQAEDGQTLVLTGLTGGKTVLLTPIQTENGIMLCQQGVRIRADIAPNLEDVGEMSMPGYPEFFEGKSSPKIVNYPELPQPGKVFDSAMLMGIGSESQGATVQELALPQGAEEEDPSDFRAPLPGAQVRAIAAASDDIEKPPIDKSPEVLPQPNDVIRSQQAYAQYREAAVSLELMQTQQLNQMLDAGIAPLNEAQQRELDAFRQANKRPKKHTAPHKKPEPNLRAAEQKRAEHAAFLAALSPSDRELYLTEQKLAKARAAALKKLKRIAADRKAYEKLQKSRAATEQKDGTANDGE